MPFETMENLRVDRGKPAAGTFLKQHLSWIFAASLMPLLYNRIIKLKAAEQNTMAFSDAAVLYLVKALLLYYKASYSLHLGICIFGCSLSSNVENVRHTCLLFQLALNASTRRYMIVYK